MRDWVECTTRSFKRIGEALGVSASTISRYAAEGEWTRPPGRPCPPAGPAQSGPGAAAQTRAPVTGEQRERIAQKLWRLAERQAEELEHQPIAVAGRALQPLARLTRTLGEMDKLRPAALAPGQYEIDNQPPPQPPRAARRIVRPPAAHRARGAGL
jgi:transposase